MMVMIKPFSALFSSVLLQMMGLGLLGTYLSLRLATEGFSPQETGYVLTFYYAGLVAGVFVNMRMIRAIGHIRSYAVFAAATMAAIMLHGLYVSGPFWAVLRFVSGIATMGMFTVIESWFNGSTPPGSRGKVFSIYMIITFLGNSLGQQFLALGEIREDTLFFVVGFFLVCSIIPISLTRAINPELPEEIPIRFSAIFKTSPIGVAGCFISGLLASAFYTMAPIFGHAIDLSVSQLSWFMGLTILGGLLFQWPIGVFSDRFDRSIVLPILGALLALSAAVVFVCAGYPFPVLMAASMLFGGVLFSIYPVSVARAHDMFASTNVVNVSSALLLSYGIGAMMGPMAASTCITRLSSPYGFYIFCSVVGLVFTASVLLLRRTEFVDIIPVAEQEDFVIMQRTSPMVLHMDPRSDASEIEDEPAL